MEPQIIFLGTGGDHFIIGKQARASGGIILKGEDFQFHIDPGPGTLTAAKHLGINLRETNALFVSHAHLNHSNDLNAVISAMTHNGLDKYGVLIASESVVNGCDGITPVLSQFHKGCVERVITPKAGQKIGINNIEIHALHSLHTDPTTIGFKFFTPYFILAYTSDTKYSKDLIEQYMGSDILILNTTYPFETDKRELLDSDAVVRILQKTEPRLAVITHFGKKMFAADPLCEARTIQKKSGVQVISAKDGMVINPTSYSAHLIQKTLNLY